MKPANPPPPPPPTPPPLKLKLDIQLYAEPVGTFYIRQTNQAVYRLDPGTSGLELRPDPRPDVRADRTEARLSRPTRQAKTDGQAKINLARANSDPEHGFSLLARLARTACTDDCADDLSTLILKLSEDLGLVGTQLARSERPAALAARPAALAGRPIYVLILTVLDTAGSDASGEEPNGHFDYHIQANISQIYWSCESYQATVRDSSFGGLVSHIKHQLKSGISKAFPQPSCYPSIHSVLHPEFTSKPDPVE
ncbi:hypothetical protein IGI04_002581 [Brassica rapa subsp. trilocularis]|uniref:Uncharacterized protein n=1 Tax=Brassica rapa subsp. trilocularis TaxID=1813537 RepID=A0ABQ7NVZ8_BRACM|nr:hypothetical protein IGI04_002581 [Brassica rapa subsp. trilocularis]